MDSNSNSYTNAPRFVTIAEVVAHQSRPDGWICPDCKYYKGGIGCEKNMFISFVGCYTKDCQVFKDKRE